MSGPLVLTDESAVKTSEKSEGQYAISNLDQRAAVPLRT